MKIKSLKIYNYKNIPPVLIKFDTDLTSLIIGQNGLGKSNILEAITIIFIALSNEDEHLNLSNLDGRYLSFEISYLLRGRKIFIQYGIDNLYLIQIDDVTYELKKNNVYDSKIINKLKKDLLPDYFVAYYSGQNKRLENILKKFEDAYILGLKTNKESSLLTERRRFLYLQNFHSPLILLSLCLFKEIEIEGEKKYLNQVSDLFKFLNIEKIEEFSLKITNPKWITDNYSAKLSDEDKKQNRYNEYILMYLLEEDKYQYPFWGLKSSLDKLLRCLANVVEPVEYNNGDEIKVKAEYKETLEFNSVSINKLMEVIESDFKNPLELFYALESMVLLGVLDVHKDLKFEIEKENASKEELKITYEALSEGENQLFIVLGIILITGNDETLFLLDEPDTYLNPIWQREYIHLLEEFNLEEDDSHIIMTTHSPLLVQNIEGEEAYKFDLLLLHRGEEGEIEFDQKESIIQNWRIDQVLASKYFGLESTRPKAIDNFMEERIKIINSYEKFDEAKAKLKEFEDENGYLPSGETIIEIESLSFLNSLKR